VKRFYKQALATEDGEGWTVRLDDRLLRTPARAPLILPTPGLADAIAAEWAAQGDDIALATMPLSGLANAAIDLVQPDPAAFARPIIAYGESDLLYYRAPEDDLAAEQAGVWNPILSWAEARYGVEFTLTSGVMFTAQHPATLAALADAVLALPPFALVAMSPLTTIGGSLVAALALVEQAFGPDTLWDALTLDEIWQEQRWGAVDDAEEARAFKRAEWMAAVRFLDLASAAAE
jgi:chaperone required for assembly of F1-ATPase